ncbi:hypothetical protein F7725_023751 [Dissostichus mawsoni]|uniref:Contactin associated protein like 3 n=1 Tax=Dissostichus mawsoni TaxID=36200 RepID=A0A7J5XXF4_DISMA|nr:hypothetical protein F7725_023751 [Dissostichus mawsoni]
MQVTLIIFSFHGETKGEVCHSPLVSNLLPSSFRSSSQLSGSHGPGFAKLNRREGAGGWSPLSSDRYQWLQVDLGERTHITAVSTQGRYGSSDWLTAYLLMFSDTGHNWRQYRQEDSIGAFPGNSNADSVVQHKLQQPVIGRYVRLIPLDWNPNGRIGLRLETFGCPYNSDVVSFDGRSSLLYRLIPRPRQATRESVSLIFKALSNSGTLLHAEGRSEHSLSLQLQKGRLLLTLQRGRSSSPDSQHMVSVGSLLDDQHWHQVTVEHHSTHLNLTVDKNTLWGNVTFSCDEPVFVAMTFTSPQSFLWLPRMSERSSSSMTVGFQFRTWNEEGLLLTFDLPKQGGAVWLYLSKTRLHLQIHKSGRAPLELNGHLSVSVDGGEGDTANASPPFPVSTDGQLFFGVCEPLQGFQGCMRLLTVDNQPVDLKKVQQRLMGNYSHLQIDMCGIIDRCSLSHCEHGGSCSQSWSSFHCNCSDTGYSGATCHSSIYEQSCEAYKHRGNTSGFYYIDVDGSGPIRPQLIYCNMTEDQTWTVIQHNNTDLTRVRPSPGKNQHSAHFEYTAEEEQLTAIISQSEHCEQEVIYLCRKSRSSTHQTALCSAGGWGVRVEDRCRRIGAELQQEVSSVPVVCSRTVWTPNTTATETLPVHSLVLGDVHRPGSESAFRETSYLHFPTFHGELSADISFLFKTTSSSGVVFSFDVGNGPLEVRVQADSPLNDNRWHRIRAERNVKEASLRLEELPAATQEAPADGHIHLQLNSQLFIGGTASRQKGFRGCIRSLQLNGVTLDLDQRARITPGVQAGCPGHCSSYGSLCKNQEVSASFKSGTSVSYTFREWVLNGSSVSSDFTLRGENISLRGENISLRGENISLSFRTSQSPALLLFVSSFHREYLAVLLNKHDMLEVRYRLDGSREAEILRSKVRNLNNAQLHAVSISRRADAVSLQIDQNTREDFNLTSDAELNGLRSLVLGRVPDSVELDPEMSRLSSLGFTGCLSAVLFNSVSPLKAALLRPDLVTGPLLPSTLGAGQPLVNAMRSDSALIGGVIAVVIFVTVSALAVTARLVYRRKGTCQNQEVKPEDSLQGGVQSENQREYYI